MVKNEILASISTLTVLGREMIQISELGASLV